MKIDAAQESGGILGAVIRMKKIARLKNPSAGWLIIFFLISAPVLYFGVSIFIGTSQKLPFTASLTLLAFAASILLYFRGCAKVKTARASLGNAFILGSFIYIVVLGIIFGGAAQLELVAYGSPYKAAPVEGNSILWSMALNALTMVVFILAFAFIRRKPLSSLGLSAKNVKRNVLAGAAAGVALFAFLIVSACVIALLSEFFGFEIPENPAAEGLSRIGMLMALFVAGGAAFTEETFFRGFLQSHIGLIASSVVFGFAHVGYGNVLQIIFPFIYGIIFGWLYKRTGTLAAPMTAHFVYDLIVIGLL